MDYARLRHWSLEHSGFTAKIDAICQTGSQAELQFGSKGTLRLVLDSQDAFAYMSAVASVDAVPIWQQLRHARLEKISLDEDDRILRMVLEQTDIYQQNRQFCLIAELSPPRPNLIWCEIIDGRLMIVDALHKYSLADNPARQILPQLPYQPPQTSWKPDARHTQAPWSLTDAASGEKLSFTDINSYFEAYHLRVINAKAELHRQKSQITHWQKAITKLQKKINKQKEELESAQQIDTWKLWAEVIKYKLGEITKGQTSLEAVNYYDPAMPNILIPLRGDLSPNQNMELYLKRYKKAKSGREVIVRLIAEGEQELSELQELLERVRAGEDLSFLTQQKKGAHSRARLSMLDKLLHIRLDDSFEIVIGRKASENDFISTQLGRPQDWWFHTRVFRGAHVLMRCLRKTEPPPHYKTIACRLAAWFSKARFSTNVPVDYTQVRYLRKPRRSAPGYITYSHYQSANVDPLEPRQVKEELRQ